MSGLLLLLPRMVLAWGSIGHRMTAENAALLLRDVEPSGFGDFLARHRFELGVYAVAPDMRFRHEDGHDGTLEAPLHFFALDAALRIMPRAAWERPYAAVRDALAKAPALGRGPWRAAQIFALAQDAFARVKHVHGTYQRGAIADQETRALFDALGFLGLLAHYVADAAVPHHASEDANSVTIGQNGLHFYFEGDCVEALEPPLSSAVLTRARKEFAARLQALGDGSVEQLMIALTAQSLSKLPALEAADRATALLARAAPGGFAKRKAPALACPTLAPMLEERLVAATVLVAHLWQRAVPQHVDWSRSGQLQFNDMSANPFLPFP